MRRIWRGALVVAATAVFAVAGYVLTHDETPPGAGTTVGSVVDPSSATTPPSSSTPTTPSPSGSASTSTSPPSQPPLVAFLGDDWTIGTRASSPAKRFSTLVCARLGLRELNFGVAGAGYAKSGAAGGPYGSRIDAVVAAHPDVVLVSGGRNDVPDNANTRDDAVRTLFRTLHRRLPNATLIAVKPFWGDSDLPPELTDLAGTVRSAVRAAGGTYLALADPLHGHPKFMADATDPNDRGYAAVADALTVALKSALQGAR